MNVILEGEGSWVGFHPVPSTPKVLDPKRESGVPLEPQPFICQNFYEKYLPLYGFNFKRIKSVNYYTKSS